MTVRPDDFAYVQAILLQEAGVELSEGKEYLVNARLLPVAKERDLESIDELIAQCRLGDREARIRVVSEMLTKETSFFRDPALWRALETQVFPDLMERTAVPRIWSAATATGQEAYSLALLATSRFAARPISVLGTDLATGALAVAQAAQYSQLEVNRGLPARYLVQYFDRNGLAWVVKPQIRDLVRFQRLNLVSESPGASFDLILLRNVLIYFGAETRERVLQRVARHLNPGGYLILGSAESTLTSIPSLESSTVGRVVAYRRQDGADS